MSRLKGCRACGAPDLEPILSLGQMPLANQLIAPDEAADPVPRWPLELVLCRRCALAQITETVPPERLFREYLYLSSCADTVLAHAADLAGELVARHGPRRVVEVASNDGYLLRRYRAMGIEVLGVEPARNVARVARAAGVPTLEIFFGAATGRAIRAELGPADIVHAHNVLAHVPDLEDFVGGLRVLLSGEGRLVIEVPHVLQLLKRCAFDTIYHEHLCYFSLTALVALLERHGLVPLQVIPIPLHGGSLQVRAALAGRGRVRGLSVRAMLAQEQQDGLCALSPLWRGFAARVDALRCALVGLVMDLKRRGARLAAYGAAAKGTVLLNYAGLGHQVIDFVADRSPLKQGRLIPGVQIPIRPPEALLQERPDFLLLLAWNFAEEIVAQQAPWQRGGGRFVVPLPEPRVL